MHNKQIYAVAALSFLNGEALARSCTISLPVAAESGDYGLQVYSASNTLTGQSSAAAIANDELLQAAIVYANNEYFAGNAANNVTICLPQGLFFFSPYGTTTTESLVTSNGTVVVTLPDQPSTYYASTGNVPSGVIDISSYVSESQSSQTEFPPLSNLSSSSSSHLTISGVGDCVNVSNGIIGPVNCPYGTAIYTDDDLVAVNGDRSNHVTFSELEFNRPTYRVTQGTVTAISTGGTANGVYTPSSVTVQMSAGFPDAATVYGYSEKQMSLDPNAPQARYMRAYTAPGNSVAKLIPSVAGGFDNSEVGWGEPSAMQSASTCTGTGVSVQGTWGAGICQVQPSCETSNGIESCQIWMNSKGTPPYTLTSPDNYVCIKAKWLNTAPYQLFGPWKNSSGGVPEGGTSEWGGTDVVFSNVTWLQTASGTTSSGFTNFQISNGYAVRAQAPSGELPCLSNTGGGPQLDVNDPPVSSYGSTWPQGTNTITSFTATATGDDSIAIFGQQESAVISLSIISDSFARGLFLSDVGTLNASGDGTSVATFEAAGGSSTTVTSTSGGNTLTRNAYCLSNYPSMTSLDCVNLSAYAP